MKKQGSVFLVTAFITFLLLSLSACAYNAAAQAPTMLSSIPDEKLLNEDRQAVPVESRVVVDSKEVAFNAYSMNSNNYFMLRDLAYHYNEAGDILAA